MEILLAAAQPLFRRAPAEGLALALETAIQQEGHRCDRIRLPWAGDGRGHLGDLRALLLLNMPGRGRADRCALALDVPAWIWAGDARRVLWLAGAPPAFEGDEAGAWRASLGREPRGFAISATAAAQGKKSLGLDLLPLYPPPAPRAEGRGPRVGPTDLALRWQPAERPALLLAALRRLPGRRLVVAELPAADHAAWRRAALDAGLADRVQLRDAAAGPFLAACRCAVSSAGFSVDPAGAIAAADAGRPLVIAADAGAATELVVDGETGRVAAPNAEAFADAIDQTLRDPASAAAWGAAARGRLGEQAGWPAVLGRLLEAAA